MVRLRDVSLVAAVAAVVGAAGSRGPGPGGFPLPFTRTLELRNPPLTGTDVYLLRGLLARGAGAVPALSESLSAHALSALRCTRVSGCVFDAETAEAVRWLQRTAGLPATSAVDPATAAAVLARLGADGHRWNGTAPAALGFRYLVRCPVRTNRSVEVECVLHGGNGTALYTFTARLHGAARLPPPAWPSWDSTGPGVNQFSPDGATPTGLAELDLNSPEDAPREYGPYPVNRATVGLAGNAGLVLTNTPDAQRGGILIHTGEWTCCGWSGPPAPMPNSLGCIHAYPESIRAVWQILTRELGVVVRPNTNGKVPYPFRSQGLLSVELVE